MRLRNNLCGIFFLLLWEMSPAINFRGTTKDEKGNALAGVFVVLESNPGYYGVSDASGAFVIDQLRSGIQTRNAERFPDSSRPVLRILNGALHISSPGSATVSVRIHTVEGRVVFNRRNVPLNAGSNAFDISRDLPKAASALLILSVSGDLQWTGRCAMMNGRAVLSGVSNSAEPVAGKTTASAYVLRATKPGYVNSLYTASNETESGILITLSLGYDADSLSTSRGTNGVYNTSQILSYRFMMKGGDWAALQNDQTNSVYYPAQMQCENDPPMLVGIRRKRSGGTVKVGLKVDINYYMPGQTFHGLNKLSLENGISEGAGDVSAGDLIAEYLGWQMMNLSGAASSRAAFIKVYVNDLPIGVYTSVEQVDKHFLQTRLGDNSGWLFKKSGSADDGQKTREAEPDPHEAFFCFMGANGNAACATPPESTLVRILPDRLAIDQTLRFGAINAFIANTDSPLFKDNNYYYYDSESGFRTYFPWDLDTGMKDGTYNVLSGGGGFFVGVLFPAWKDRYVEIFKDLLASRLTLEKIHAELQRVQVIAGTELDADPFVTGDAAGDIQSLRTWWAARFANVQAQLGL